MRVALRTVTYDGDLLALDQREVGVFVVINFHGSPLLERGRVKQRDRRAAHRRRAARRYTFKIRSPRPMPLTPVRTVSRISCLSIASMKASSFELLPVNSTV